MLFKEKKRKGVKILPCFYCFGLGTVKDHDGYNVCCNFCFGSGRIYEHTLDLEMELMDNRQVKCNHKDQLNLF